MLVDADFERCWKTLEDTGRLWPTHANTPTDRLQRTAGERLDKIFTADIQQIFTVSILRDQVSASLAVTYAISFR